jgi:hypothetical protein
MGDPDSNHRLGFCPGLIGIVWNYLLQSITCPRQITTYNEIILTSIHKTGRNALRVG